METNYKAKYLQLREMFMDAVDTAFRLGIQQGAMQAQMDQFAQQQQQQQEMEQAQAQGMGGDPNQPGAEGGMPGEESQEQPPQDSANPGGSELDQHIQKLEGMLGKSEGLDIGDLKKAIEGLKSLQKEAKFQTEMKKSAAAIPKIAQALHKPAFKISQQANHNMASSAKTAVSMQHKIVNDVMAKMAEEEKRAANSIEGVLKNEGLIKE